MTEGLYRPLPSGLGLIFRSVRILTMSAGKVHENSDVLVRAGQVEAIEPAGSIDVEGAHEIDGHGCTLMPGLSDLHTHIFTSSWARAFAPFIDGTQTGEEFVLPYQLMLFKLLAAGITRVEILAGCADALWMREAVRSGQVIGPRLVVGSPLIDGNPSLHTPLISYQIGDREGGRLAARQIAELGYDFAKPYSALPLAGYQGLVKECRNLGIRLMGHVPSCLSATEAIGLGQQGIAHAVELFQHLSPEDRGQKRTIRQIADFLASNDISLQATVTVTDRVEGICGTRPLTAPDAAWMNPLHRAMWSEGSPLLEVAARPARREMYRGSYELSCAYTQAAFEAGATLLTGTDCPNPFIVEGFSLHEEIERLAADCGMANHDVLFASTRLAANYHGEGPLAGSLVAGAPAELICVRGNPLENIRCTRNVEAVVLGDRLIDKARIDEGLHRVRSAYQAMPEVRLGPADGPARRG